LIKAGIYAFCALLLSTQASVYLDAFSVRRTAIEAATLAFEILSLCAFSFILVVDIFRLFAGKKTVKTPLFVLFAALCAGYRLLTAFKLFSDAEKPIPLNESDAYAAIAVAAALFAKLAMKERLDEDAK